MQIQWKYPTELQIVVDEINGNKIFEQKNWKSGDKEEVTIINDHDNHVDLLFKNCFVAYYVDKSLYKEIL